MGHLATNNKEIYKKLHRKIDGMSARIPNTEAFRTILNELYTPEEAMLVAKMPYSPSSFGRIQRLTGIDENKLRTMLEKLADIGLVLDVWSKKKNQYYYLALPFVIGIFEFTMMRTKNTSNEQIVHFAQMLRRCMKDKEFYNINKEGGEKVGLMRTIPHLPPVPYENYVQIYDYQKIESIVEEAELFAIGLCSCRHEAHHLQDKKCEVPLETCCTFNTSADYLIRHQLAKQVDKSQMKESIAKAKEFGLVLNIDNVKKRPSFLCQCCSCCCNLINAINNHQYHGLVVSSGMMPKIEPSRCTFCKLCLRLCPVKAISANENRREDQCRLTIDEKKCLGCSVCAVKCPKGAMKMVDSPLRPIYPEDTLEKYILMYLEKGNLQNQIFDNPQSLTQDFMRVLVGAFLRLPPVKKALMSETFRSRFFSYLSNVRGARDKVEL